MTTEDEAPANSTAPAAIEVVREAKSTRFQISILLLAALVGAAYWAGRDSSRGIAEAQLQAFSTIQDERLKQINNALEAQAKIAQAGYRDIAEETRGVRREMQGLSAEIEVIKSHVK